MRVLLIEDDEKLRRAMCRVLGHEGYAVEQTGDGRSGIAMGMDERFDAIVLDILLPEVDGLRVCRALRAARVDTPILMLTALGEVDQRVQGLDAGADDYLTKPFAFRELLARLRAVARRGASHEDHSVLGYDDLRIDVLKRQAHRGNTSISLTDREFRVLELLLRNSEIVLSRGRILDEVWGLDYEGDSNVVETYIHYLRRKIDGHGRRSLIHTVRGAGYVLRASE